jgi:hypothetical protein
MAQPEQQIGARRQTELTRPSQLHGEILAAEAGIRIGHGYANLVAIRARRR